LQTNSGFIQHETVWGIVHPVVAAKIIFKWSKFSISLV